MYSALRLVGLQYLPSCSMDRCTIFSTSLYFLLQTWLPFMEPRQKKGDKAQILKRCCPRVKCFIGKSDLQFNTYSILNYQLCIRVVLFYLSQALPIFFNKHLFLTADTDAGFNPTQSKVYIFLTYCRYEVAHLVLHIHTKITHGNT